MTQKKVPAAVARLPVNASAREPPGGDDDEKKKLERYITDRVADLLALAGTFHHVDPATAGNEIVLAVIDTLEVSEIHVSKDLEPLRTLMVASEKVQREEAESQEDM